MIKDNKLLGEEFTDVESLPLLGFNDPNLYKVPTDVDIQNEVLEDLKHGLLKIMKHLGGVGLSANQVGVDARFFVVGDGLAGGMNKAYFNPEIIGVGKEEESIKEGCLSFPGLWLMVKRPTECAIKYTNTKKKEVVETYKGVTARVILHEYDHMLGQNFTMRVSRIKLERALKALQKKVKKYQRKMSELE